MRAIGTDHVRRPQAKGDPEEGPSGPLVGPRTAKGQKEPRKSLPKPGRNTRTQQKETENRPEPRILFVKCGKGRPRNTSTPPLAADNQHSLIFFDSTQLVRNESRSVRLPNPRQSTHEVELLPLVLVRSRYRPCPDQGRI